MAAAAILKLDLRLCFCDFSNSACVSYSLYQFSSNSGGNCPFYSIHFNFQHGGGGHLETWSTPRYCNFQTQHAFFSLFSNLHQNRVVIAHFIAFTAISNMAAAAILKLDLHFRYCNFQTQHVFLSLCINFHQNRMVIAHFIAFT
jgi:hypothetical protein